MTKLRSTGLGQTLTNKTQEVGGSWQINDSPFLTMDSPECGNSMRQSCVSAELWPAQPCTTLLLLSLLCLISLFPTFLLPLGHTA